ncbi:hypothetical protein KA005_67870 [bacterium]|nr:hypothetical protein [bacterium]
MMKTPDKIWLREDREDPGHIVWGGDQPADGGVEYIKIDKSMAKTEGTWPKNDIRRAFIAGTEWWQNYIASGFAMYPSDQKLVKEETKKRYGFLPVDKRKSENEIREELASAKYYNKNKDPGSPPQEQASAIAIITILKWVLNEEDKE